MTGQAGSINSDNLSLRWMEAPWDTRVFGFPVLQITQMEILGPDAQADFQQFESIRDEYAAGLVSCRLQHERLKESMLLERGGFRFIEMIYQPQLEIGPRTTLPESSLATLRASEEDMPEVAAIAESAFKNERFHVDPRLNSSLGDLRYRNWVLDSFDHSRQRLTLLRDGHRLVAFFVWELLPDGTCYWHLNAVAPAAQGQGFGARAWTTMLHRARADGAKRVRTCIVARNHRVLNLYARLGFRFPPPEMTFHWVATDR